MHYLTVLIHQWYFNNCADCTTTTELIQQWLYHSLTHILAHTLTHSLTDSLIHSESLTNLSPQLGQIVTTNHLNFTSGMIILQ